MGAERVVVVVPAVDGLLESLPDEQATRVKANETTTTRENPTASRCSRSPLCQIHVVASERSQEYYDEIKRRFAEERDLRLSYRPEGTAQFTSELDGRLRSLRGRPLRRGRSSRAIPIDDEVEVLFIGGGFSALLTAARLREVGVESIRIVERGGDVGGTWYWNRYPGVACDVVAYDYLPLLDEMGYVPTRHYAEGWEIFEHCQAIARRYDLYDLAVFQTTVTSTVWHEDEQLWHLTHRPRRHDAGSLRDLRERHAVEAEAGEDRRHGDVRRATPSTPRGGTTTTPARTSRTSMTRSSGSSAPVRPRCRSIPNLGEQREGALRLPAHAVVDRHQATTGRPIRSGLRS